MTFYGVFVRRNISKSFHGEFIFTILCGDVEYYELVNYFILIKILNIN